MNGPVNLFSFGLNLRMPNSEGKNPIRFTCCPYLDKSSAFSCQEILPHWSYRCWNAVHQSMGEYLFTIDRTLRRIVMDSTCGDFLYRFCASVIHFL